MKISLLQIPDKGMKIEDEISPDEIGLHELSFSIDNPIKISLFLEIVDNVLIAKGSYCGTVLCICDRCLKKFESKHSKSDYLLGKDFEGLQEETIDLTEGILEDILLGLPLKMLCSKDCRGICPQCGADLNVGKCTCKKLPDILPFSELDELI